jgi:phenazine biosynthesis protein phzE
MPEFQPDLLDHLIRNPDARPFAVLHRSDGPGVEILVGDMVDVERLADIPLPELTPGSATLQVLALVPYRQVTERGFVCHDDATPLRCLLVRGVQVLEVAEVVDRLPAEPPRVTAGAFDVDDAAYADLVARVITDEIGTGAGADFVLRRDHVSHTEDPPGLTALRVLRRLLTAEPGAYWTFAVHAGDVTMVGATPERHVSSSAGGEVVMNPISGTYRFPADGPAADGLLSFLADPKETEELFMVVDEELKMMSRICTAGGQVIGPRLKQMSALAHTEYLLRGTTGLDVREVLRETMFAPTVTGSPVENAARVIARYETTGRGYYSGVLALMGQDGEGRRTLDAPILIRTAHLSGSGEVRVPVGATLVRQSDPASEVAETHAKAAAVLRALGVIPPPANRPPTPPLDRHPGIAAALVRRNTALADFWLQPQRDRPVPALAGRTALLVDAEDDWTAMLAHLLRRLGMTATVRRWTADGAGDLPPDAFDLLVAGPGPGDPRRLDDLRIRTLHRLVRERRQSGLPLLAVCLSHQVLAAQLGLTVAPLPAPHQGTQRRIDLFGSPVRVGYYNTFAAFTTPSQDKDRSQDATGLRIAADPVSGEVHALRGPGFASVQFHLESLLSPDGATVLGDLAGSLLSSSLVQPRTRIGSPARKAATSSTASR